MRAFFKKRHVEEIRFHNSHRPQIQTNRRKMESKDEKMEAKDEDDDDTAVKADPDDDGDSDGHEESREEADIRDIRYKLEILY